MKKFHKRAAVFLTACMHIHTPTFNDGPTGMHLYIVRPQV